MAVKGGYRPNSGRKSKAEEVRIRDMISPYISDSITTLVSLSKSAEKDSDKIAAIKLLIAYYAGQPPQFIEGTFETTGITVTVKE